jgi:hypothetical protein
MANLFRILRSSVFGRRPAIGAQQEGVLYANFADKQIGVVDSTQTPQDMIGVPYFSITANYNAGQPVAYQGQFYLATVTMTAGAWNASNWSQVVKKSGDTITGPLTVNAALNVNAAVTVGSAGSLTVNGTTLHTNTVNIAAGATDTSLVVSSTQNARIGFIVPNVRFWAMGCVSAGHFILTDVSGGVNYFAGDINLGAVTVSAPAGMSIYGGYGIRYPCAGGQNAMAFSWSTIVSGLATVHIDNAVFYAIANGNSDGRLKQDMENSTYDCLAQINSIPLHKFRWKDHKDPGKLERVSSDTPFTPVGFHAQELYKIAPYLVRPGNTSEGPYNKDNPIHLWQIDEVGMLSTLVGAVQQLTKRNTELEARLQALEEK